MKILQINSVCGIGSTGRIATDIDSILKGQGHLSYIAYGRGESINCETAIKIGSPLDVYSHIVKTRLMDRHGFGSKNSTKAFIREIEKMEFDVIHLHNIHGYYVNIEMLFDYLKNISKPVVWTLHDCWSFTGHCAYFDYVGCDKWLEECISCPQKKSYPKSFWKDNSNINFNDKARIFNGVQNLTIITPSAWLARKVGKSFLKEYPIQIINNGIDLDIFKPSISSFREKYNVKEKFIILGVASIWDNRKGFNTFIELSKRLTNDQVIVMVGLDSKVIDGLPHNIIGINKTNDIKELAEIYSAADVFFNPTLEDNFPTTNLEALACGIPVITFDTGGSIESVPEKCGFIVKQHDLNEVICKFNIIGTEKKYLKDCINYASTNYDKNEKFNEYINLYRYLV